MNPSGILLTRSDTGNSLCRLAVPHNGKHGLCLSAKKTSRATGRFAGFLRTPWLVVFAQDIRFPTACTAASAASLPFVCLSHPCLASGAIPLRQRGIPWQKRAFPLRAKWETLPCRCPARCLHRNFAREFLRSTASPNRQGRFSHVPQKPRTAGECGTSVAAWGFSSFALEHNSLLST